MSWAVVRAASAQRIKLASQIQHLVLQRDALSAEIYKRTRRDKNDGVPDTDADDENAILDLKEDNK
jgi:hypothetical protein